MIKKLFLNTFWLFIYTVAVRSSIFILNILVARIGGQELYGQYSLIKSTVSTIEGGVSGSISTPAIKYFAIEAREKKASSLAFFILTLTSVNLLLFLLFYWFRYSISEAFYSYDSYKIYLLAFFLLSSISLSNLIQSVFIGHEKFHLLVVASFFSLFLQIPLAYFFLKIGTLQSFLFTITLFYFIDLSVKYLLIPKEARQFNKIDYKKYLFFIKKLMSNDTSLLLISAIVNGVSFYALRLILVGDGMKFKDLALYDASFQLFNIINLASGTIASVVMPRLVTDNSSKRKALNVGLVVNITIASMCAIFLIFFPNSLLALFGNEFKVYDNTFVYFSLAALCLSASYIFHRFNIATDRSKEVLKANIVSMVGMFLILYSCESIGVETIAKAVFIYYLIVLTVYTFSYLKNYE